MIEPEVVPPAVPSRRHRRAVVAGVTLLAVVAGGLAVAGGGGSEPKPLALMAANGDAAAGRAEASLAAPVGTPSPVAPAMAADSARSSLPYGGGWGLKFEVEGQLPALPDHAPAWTVETPNLDRAALTRIANALGVPGTPVQRDGGWYAEGGDWSFSAYGGDTMGKGGAWYLNLYRSRFNGAADDAASPEPVGPAISAAAAEQKVRALLADLGAPDADWKFETTETEVATGNWSCPSPPMTPEELTKLEAEKLRRIEAQPVAGTAVAPSSAVAPKPAGGATTVVDPAPPVASGAGRASGAGTSANAGSGVATPAPGTKPGAGPSCTPPPPPVKGYTVALFPVLDGRRADWPVWNVTLRSDGRLENLYGSWVSFSRGDNYKLRGVEAALKDLQSPPVAYATDTPAAAVDLPADAPVCPPMPLPARDGGAAARRMAPCGPQESQVVKITGVELGLIQTSVFEDGEVRMAMVPSYRFTGHFAEGDMPWETSVLALHPSAIAPPPAYPVDADGGNGAGATGVGKAVPPTPAAEPAVARDLSSR